MWHLMTVACLLGAAMGQHWHGGVHDTPEVEAAKAAHFAAHAKARAHLGGHGHGWDVDDRSWGHEAVHHEPVHHQPAPIHEHHWEEPHQKWTGPIALPPGYDKHGAPLPVHDTPEVEAEKHRHFALYTHGAYAGAYAARHDASHGAYAAQHDAPHGAPRGEWSEPAYQSDWTPSAGPWGY